jgi:hypothetical protein
MPRPLAEVLTREKCFLFRITHRDNVPHLLAHGTHCRNSPVQNSAYVEIGHPEIIDRRRAREVQVPPGGTLADYVPFYFTPCTPMLYNIVTGYHGLTQRARSEIAVLVTSMDRLEAVGARVVVADRNATLGHAVLRPGRELLGELPWDRWRSRDFKHDANRPDKVERYHAEALVNGTLPTAALLAIITYDDAAKATIAQAVAHAGLLIPVHTRPDWYP